MIITTRSRPWDAKAKHGKRYNPNPYYQSQLWKRIKKAFALGHTLVNGVPMSNTLCTECFKEGKTVAKDMDDHIIPISEGGSATDHSNLQGLCSYHHAVKSATEGNSKHKNTKANESIKGY